MTSTTMDAATAELLTGSLRELFAGSAGREIGPALAALGWAEVVAEDPAGATTLLFTEQGRALASSPALDAVLLAELDRVLPAGHGTRAVLYPHPADGDRPSTVDGPVRGILLAGLDSVDELVVPVRVDGAVALLTADPGGVTTEPVAGFDGGSGWFTVTGRQPSGTPVPAAREWERAVAAGRRALAAEIAGVCQAALDLAVAHTSARVQYGRPIASFQAVRHRLAEAHVAINDIASMLDAAWPVAGNADGGAWAAALTKLRAGRAQAEVMRHGVQVLGAMGLTSESAMHSYVTRAGALDALLGGHRLLSETTGRALLAGAPADPVVEV
ncbi:acyl-CoA dehydrogenase family protein [Amycolatopsis sp.]|uniref:acyl-CoA dehydrogenase family protein n=1 Tax=Amycolatopsis sp. TaxID=37632 RepID=UPI002CEB722B|nr:acyl-CoA dehydrogenase family protein [Amycolatopsis sp.]HVV08173.1 acyl-CoA dehydrogenase family protein [Amycolatopsis sp.]